VYLSKSKSQHHLPSHSGKTQGDVLRFYRMESYNDRPLVLLDTATLAELYFLLYLEKRREASLLERVSKRDSYEEALAYGVRKGLI